LGFRQGVQMPAIQLAELLAELADVEPDVSRQPGPIGIPFLDAHIPVLEAHKDLGARVGVERRLKPDFELPRVEVLTLDALEARARPPGVAQWAAGRPPATPPARRQARRRPLGDFESSQKISRSSVADRPPRREAGAVGGPARPAARLRTGSGRTSGWGGAAV